MPITTQGYLLSFSMHSLTQLNNDHSSLRDRSCCRSRRVFELRGHELGGREGRRRGGRGGGVSTEKMRERNRSRAAAVKEDAVNPGGYKKREGGEKGGMLVGEPSFSRMIKGEW